MPASRPRLARLSLLGILLGGVLVVCFYFVSRKASPPDQPSPIVTTQPAPATRPAPPPAVAAPRTYMDLVLRAYPTLPTTRPLDQPVMLPFAAHLVLSDPVHLDSRGYLWITRADAEETDVVLESRPFPSTILTRERPLFVHWAVVDEVTTPHLVCRNAAGDGFELVTASRRVTMGRDTDYDWPRAFSYEERFVVPTSAGASVFSIDDSVVTESASPNLAEPGEQHAGVQIAFFNGPLIWIPPSGEHPGSRGAFRCVETTWFELTPQQGWPQGLLHLIPLLDGSVLQLIGGPDDSVRLALAPLDAAEIDERAVRGLIVRLSDPDPELRNRAYEELTRYGPGMWPIAEKMIKVQPPEARERLKDLLGAKLSPLMGSGHLVDGKMRLVKRFNDGGALFFAKAGLSIPQGQEEPLLVEPAWLAVRPQSAIRLLPADLASQLDPEKSIAVPTRSNEWLILDDQGPRGWIAGSFRPLLHPHEQAFTRFLGSTRDNRLLFQGEVGGDNRTLVIDPRLSDPTPRLPVWLYSCEGTVGWDKEGWPAARHGGAWSLRTRDWRPIDEAKEEKFFEEAEPLPPPPSEKAAPVAATLPSNEPKPPAEEAENAGEGAPANADRPSTLLIADGTWYLGGQQDLTLVDAEGIRTVWPLPPAATGDLPAHLVRSPNGRLFLYNHPGRLSRLRPTGDPDRPVELEATFTERIPELDAPRRIWLDPAGRLIIAYDTNKLAICFPDGFIPTETLNLLTADDVEAILK